MLHILLLAATPVKGDPLLSNGSLPPLACDLRDNLTDGQHRQGSGPGSFPTNVSPPAWWQLAIEWCAGRFPICYGHSPGRSTWTPDGCPGLFLESFHRLDSMETDCARCQVLPSRPHRTSKSWHRAWRNTTEIGPASHGVFALVGLTRTMARSRVGTTSRRFANPDSKLYGLQ